MTPTFSTSRPLQCRSSSSWRTSLHMSFSLFLASPLLAFADTTLPGAGGGHDPSCLLPPTRPGRSHPRKKQAVPRALQGAFGAPTAPWRTKEAQPPRAPRARESGRSRLPGALGPRGEGRARARTARPATLPCSLSFMRSPFVWNYLNGRSAQLYANVPNKGGGPRAGAREVPGGGRSGRAGRRRAAGCACLSRALGTDKTAPHSCKHKASPGLGPARSALQGHRPLRDLTAALRR